MKFKSHLKPALAEMIGTASLTLVVLISLNNPEFPISTPVLAAITLGLFVLTIGPVSGTHINPAVTIALASLRKISTEKAIVYIVAQLLGAGIAMYLAGMFVAVPVEVTNETNMIIGMAELLGSMLFGFGIASVVYSKLNEVASSLTIGLSLFIGISIAAIGSNGVLNPAVAWGIGSFSAPYILAPIIGQLLGMWGYKKLREM